MSAPSPSDRLDILDGLRGLAIALVVWYHAWLVSGRSIAGLNFVAQSGFLGVDLFFFISGFCLFFPYARALRDGRALPTVRHFFTRRAVKIVPSYLLALAVFAVVYHARFTSLGDAAIQIASHLAFVHTLSPWTFGAISGPLWTIGVEVQFYLIFPLICPLFRRAPLVTYGALVLVSESYRVAIDHAGLGSAFLFFNQLPAYLDVFGAGMLGASLYVRYARRAGERVRLPMTFASITAFAVGIAGLAYVSGLGDSDSMDATYAWVNAHRLFFGPLCVALALATSFATSGWRNVVATRVTAFLSLISYNLYLWNLEIAVWYHQAGFDATTTFVLGIATSLLLATAITFGLERPILEADLAAWWRVIRARAPQRTTG